MIRTIPKKCDKITNAATTTLEESGISVHIQNSRNTELHVITVDGCIFKGNDGKRCDYLINVTERGTSYLIELKSTNVDAAFEQLRISLERLSQVIFNRRRLIIVHSANPRVSSNIQGLKDTASKNYKAPLIVIQSNESLEIT